MSERATVDYQTKLAHAAIHTANVKHAREQLLIAEANLVRAEADLAKYLKENK